MKAVNRSPARFRKKILLAIFLTTSLLESSGVAQAQTWENLPQPAVPTNSILAQSAMPENPQGIPINPGTNGESVPTPEFPAQLKAGPEGNQEGYYFSLADVGKTVGQELQSDGIYLGGSYTAVFGNVTGGNENGQGYNGDADRKSVV